MLADKIESAHLFSRRTNLFLSNKVSSGQGHMRRVMDVKGVSVLDQMVLVVSTYGKAWMTLQPLDHSTIQQESSVESGTKETRSGLCARRKQGSSKTEMGRCFSFCGSQTSGQCNIFYEVLGGDLKLGAKLS
jgi:hypothetical protein